MSAVPAAPAAQPHRPSGAAARRRAALVMMAASGFAALGYQIVWTRQAALWLGHEVAAVLAVVAAFFGGLAAGALALGPRIDRSRHPARWYAVCEVVIALWSGALAFLLGPATGWLLEVTGARPDPGSQWLFAFGGTFLLLLPATAAMGATLPAMERVLAQLRERGTSLAALYAGNTFGAVIGVLAAAFWLVPALGLTGTALVCMAANLACAALTPWLFAGIRAPAPASAARPGGRAAAALLAATGLLGIGYEVMVVRVLSQVFENTVYTFAILLAVYLVGTALGAAAYHLRQDRAIDADARGRQLLRLLAAACLLGVAALAGADAARRALLALFGPGVAGALLAEAAVATAALLPPTFAMGALFSHLCIRAQARGIGFGTAIGVNTLGAAAAPLLFGVLLLPAAGFLWTLLAIAAGYLLLSATSPGRLARAPLAWATAAAIAAMAAWSPALTFVDVPEGGRLVSLHTGATATVSIVEDGAGVARLHIDNRDQEGSNATRYADSRQGLLPILLHPQPQRALFLGVGTGITAAAAARDPGLHVDAVELLPEVLEASAWFRKALDGEDDTARLRLVAADARRFVRASREHYDVVVSDNFHPARSGTGALYTVEHFAAVRERLAAHGVFCQWLPLHQLDLDTLRSIVGSFLAVFPRATAILATNSLETPVIGLIGRAGDDVPDAARLRARVAAAAGPLRLAAFGIPDELALLGSVLAGPDSLARFADGAPLNTDDRPVVAYRAPRHTYAPDSRPRDRLIALVRDLDAKTEDVVAADPAWRARLAAYWAARDRFVEAGRDVRPSGDVRHMLAQVREPLLAVLRTSPDFDPAYDPLVRMAGALARTDPAAARILLEEVRAAQPARPEADRMLSALRAAPASPPPYPLEPLPGTSR